MDVQFSSLSLTLYIYITLDENQQKSRNSKPNSFNENDDLDDNSCQRYGPYDFVYLTLFCFVSLFEPKEKENNEVNQANRG